MELNTPTTPPSTTRLGCVSRWKTPRTDPDSDCSEEGVEDEEDEEDEEEEVDEVDEDVLRGVFAGIGRFHVGSEKWNVRTWVGLGGAGKLAGDVGCCCCCCCDGEVEWEGLAVLSPRQKRWNLNWSPPTPLGMQSHRIVEIYSNVYAEEGDDEDVVPRL
ncbi:uncharacterized protein BDR25DRAFT_346228 [Lindgomyces ingoldianus]|uniref:Uncharacterized protein n=1 Tax=Lindgomyces ingoldianus TaxID=673940 RepID=A0ACB6QFS6_9PLEO|nr:uncharacterized protein BDR25DRAFT_346228 [Lindgomyces ingoldianus]KAF2465355.1 hypothetical protein BDR25DRAFT_346228 [Lindgomyces ingoldianus]